MTCDGVEDGELATTKDIECADGQFLNPEGCTCIDCLECGLQTVDNSSCPT